MAAVAEIGGGLCQRLGGHRRERGEIPASCLRHLAKGRKAAFPILEHGPQAGFADGLKLRGMERWNHDRERNAGRAQIAK